MKENMILNNLNLRKSSMTVRSFMTLLIMLTMTMVVNAKSTNAMYGGVTSAPVEDVYILGEINGKGWVTNDGVKMTRGEDGIYTATISTDKNGKNYFCLTKKLSETENDWDTVNANRFGAFANGGNEMDNFAITSELLGEEITLSYEGYNMAFEINEGVYTLTLDLNKMTLVAKRLDEVYILGHVNDNDWATNVGLPMTRGEDGLYTATIIADGRVEGANYFSFTHKLSDNPDDWDAIDMYRFGAQSDGDFWVTDDLIGEELSIIFKGRQAFRVPKGEYTLTLDLDNLKLVIGPPKYIGPLSDVYIIGNINDNDWATNVGVKMNTSENGIYTATITADENKGYFEFTTKLTEEAYDWDGIAPYRIGATRYQDGEITQESLGKEISLFKQGATIHVPAGKYNLTLDLVNLKLVVTAAPSVATEIDQVSSDKSQITSGEWFTFDGRKLSGKPAKKGVYIHNGKKVVMLQ